MTHPVAGCTLAVLGGAWLMGISAQCSAQTTKTESAFYPAKLVEKARENAKKYPWAAEIQKQIVATAQPWMKYSDDQLWELMFGNTLKRSWMVWSDGHCPACKKSVPMYTWKMEALKLPWKVRCPHCQELFPKNDFGAFYRSGLDGSGVFDPQRADRALLFNAEHPQPQDKLHKFGVDDGDGFVEGGKRWRFIGAYLIYGQWKQAVTGGIGSLATAYVATGDPTYAHKAGVLLDRVADLYPSFDYEKEGLVYEAPRGAGYVSIWHDACEETREMVFAYDAVFDALKGDRELVAFLSKKAKQFKLANPKSSFEEIQRNIEDRILRDALNHQEKIHSNYPRTPLASLTIATVLGWPGNREAILGGSGLDGVFKQATAADGVSGEKGLANYSAYAVQSLAKVLAQYARMDPAFLADMFKRNPQLRQTFRFHVDTLCLQKYYPLSGDAGVFARPTGLYAGAVFSKDYASGGSAYGSGYILTPSMFTFFWRLYELTGDPAFVQVLYRANENSTDGLPHDLFSDDPDGFQKSVGEVITREGQTLKLGSTNKTQWHLAILRSGQGSDERAVWLDYDSGGQHSHHDGMNLGLFARGLDLLPDFGYPPVQYGGWESPRATWYKMSAAHNTVVVNGANHADAAGASTLWADGRQFHAVRASGASIAGGKEFERTVVLLDLSERNFCVLDVFRVAGGLDHARFTRTHFGQAAANGLTLKPAAAYGFGTQMRNFQSDPSPREGWSVDWKIADEYKLLAAGAEVHIRYTDLTRAAQAFLAESWVSIDKMGNRGFDSNEEAWIPTVMVRRQSKEVPLASTFVSVLEPYEKKPACSVIRRLGLETPEGQAFPDSHVALEIQGASGASDLILFADVENPLGLKPSRADSRLLKQKEWDVELDGELGWVRRDAQGRLLAMALGRGLSLRAGPTVLRVKKQTEFVEVAWEQERPVVVRGNPEEVEVAKVTRAETRPGLDVRPSPVPFYADKKNLLVYLDAAGQAQPVKSAADWQVRRRHLLANMQLVMGSLPDTARKVPLDVKVLEETAVGELVRKKITFAVEPDDRVPAYLFVPKQAQGRLPALLCLHQTHPLGKSELAGIGGNPNLHYALELAKLGYVTLAPDYPVWLYQPEYSPEYRVDPYKTGYVSATMKGIWNHMCALDLLEGLPEVDSERMGCIGHSLGGYNTLFLASFDPRVKVAVSSAGFNSFFKYHGGDLSGWSHKGHMPRIATVYGKDPQKMPFDFTEVIAALAPRPLFVNAPLQDDIFEVSGVRDCIEAASPVYRLLQRPDGLVVRYPAGKHDFPPEVRKEAYAFLGRYLKP